MKDDRGLIRNWIETLGFKHALIFGIVGLFIYKIVDMNTLQWFGKTIFISNDSSILGFLVSGVFFWSCVIFIIFPIFKLLGLIKGKL